MLQAQALDVQRNAKNSLKLSFLLVKNGLFCTLESKSLKL